jgi:hypothetical protein
MKAALFATAALVAGVAIGLAAPRLWPHQQTLEECLIERMKGLPGPMFATVYTVCEAAKWPGRPMTDAEVGIEKKDDWQPVIRK